jgi:uncharacterized cupredoxin-like copper-binding protein
MADDFRKRWAVPLLMLFGIILLIALVLFGIASILLAVPGVLATMLALLIALYVLVVGGLVGKYRRQLSVRALGGGLAVGLAALFIAGVLAVVSGPYEPAAEEAAANGEEGEAADIPADAYVWVAFDLGYEDPPASVPAGEVTIAIDNTGNLPHDVTVDGEFHVEAPGGQQAWETVTLDPGEYYYYCSVPGHEPQMNGTLLVE